MKTHANHAQTFRNVPATSKPLSESKVGALLDQEWARYKEATSGSEKENKLASQSVPLGVPSSFQYWEPYPISIKSAKGAWMTDMDDRQVLDMSMGFGAMLAGHLNPVVVNEIKESLEVGTLFVTPSPISRDAAERICKRFNLEQVRFTNSGTESTMYAIRTARAYTGKTGVVKVEGGYHGSYDPLTVSVKPKLDDAGDPENPNVIIDPATVVGDVFVVPYNDAEALERTFAKHKDKIACFVVEPVLENIAIVLPDAGYLEQVRALCDQYGIVLIFDEVKTGLTAGPQGAAQRLGVQPDLITIAKSIGGGVPVAAFGGKKKFMEAVTNGRMAHFGTFNGNPLAMAGVRAIDKICTPETLGVAEGFNMQALNRISEIIAEYELPAHTVGFGVKGCISWSTTPIRNYRDYKATDFKIAELSWLWSINRGIMTPPGLDEQWLISLAHGQKEIDILVEDFRSLAAAIRN
ncbi:aspartate aminotransferase family protein [Actinomycetes bacterium]|nr:aspartate aminotransferase family protein [Actinomycetes bacterium]